MTLAPKLRNVAADNPIHLIRSDLLRRLVEAQENALDRHFDSAFGLVSEVLDQLRVLLVVPDHLRQISAADFADRRLQELVHDLLPLLDAGGVVGPSAKVHAVNLAQRIHLVRSFHDPDTVVANVSAKVEKIVQTFPKEAKDIERGRNPGDVLDPYILAATQTLLYSGRLQGAVEATVAHKALMIIEGLMGHLHEDVIGAMRGNVRAPEPKREDIDRSANPFPGADIVQPPSGDWTTLRFHQVKSKTGSAKGGDGRRLGDQLRRLRELYGGEVYYDALIGHTLRGHRSMRGVLTAEPKAVVLVGDAAFRELTGSKIGPQLLLRVYQGAFSEAAHATGYRLEDMVERIVLAFRERAEHAGEEGYLELLLDRSIGSTPDQQDSRTYQPRRRRTQR